MEMQRREFLRNSLLTGAALGAISAAPIAIAAEHPRPALKLSDITSMDPVEMARGSLAVQAAFELLLGAAKRVGGETGARIADQLMNPSVTIDVSRDEAVARALKDAGLLAADRGRLFPENADPAKAPQPFWSATGSGWASHHAYPGGLAIHTAVNVASAERLCDTYERIAGCRIDREAAVGGELLHDIHKPWVFQWQPTFECRKELQLAATGEHHVLSVAESICRGYPAELVVAQAAAHEHPGSANGEKLVAGWLKAAAMIAGVDPVEEGLLTRDGRLPAPVAAEGFVVHLADHDFIISGPACVFVVSELASLARDVYGIDPARDQKAFAALRNFVLANLTAMRLYQIRAQRGREAFAKEVRRVVISA